MSKTQIKVVGIILLVGGILWLMVSTALYADSFIGMSANALNFIIAMLLIISGLFMIIKKV